VKQIEVDKEVIANIRNGDARSLHLLFHAVYPHLCAYAASILHDHDEAEEIVQDVFFKLWINRQHLDETLSIKAYMFTAVKNNALKTLAHQKVKNKYQKLLEYVHHSLPNTSSADELLLSNELEQEFTKALQSLSGQSRRIFELSRMEGLTYQQIATRLNISPKTVETQMSRALQKLRLQLKDYILLVILLQD
jgi:RNA polymerase sigma-70 factor, ECF subfamily